MQVTTAGQHAHQALPLRACMKLIYALKQASCIHAT